jgi:alkanesulfonate monooxygenase SsuD/methylene tetrahydromethanopterin reductase-like flavin-dependent oxidoreductase (luciferase family)
VRIGLFLAYWPWFSPEEQVALARQADEAGLDSVWVAEAWGQDAVSVLGHLSAVTKRVALGSGLMQIPGRTPAMTAMTAATLDVLSGGRFRLGLGVSGPQVSEGWHGVPFARPLARTREYVEIVRAALAREAPLEYEGREFRLPVDPDGLGKPLKLLLAPEC